MEFLFQKKTLLYTYKYDIISGISIKKKLRVLKIFIFRARQIIAERHIKNYLRLLILKFGIIISPKPPNCAYVWHY